MNDEWTREVRTIVADPTKRPALHELMHAETGRVIDAITDDSLAPGAAFSDDEFARRLAAYERATEDLASAAVQVAYWAELTDDRLNPTLVARVANAPDRSAGQSAYLDLCLYPALLVLYAAGLASVIGRREEQLADLLGAATIRNRGKWSPTVLVVNTTVIDPRVAQRLPGLERHHTPASDHLFEVTRPWLAELEPDANRFEWMFDRWEYLLGLIAFDISRQRSNGGWAPVGRFSWRARYADSIDQAVAAEIDEAGARWPLLRAGLFGGDEARLAESIQGWQSHLERVRHHQW